MKIILGKGSFAGPISGADEAFVSYALHLHEAGHLHSVVLFYPPRKDDAYYLRLSGAGVRVTCITSFPLLHPISTVWRKVARAFHIPSTVPYRSPRLRAAWFRLLRAESRFYLDRCRAHFSGLGADLIHVVTPDTAAALMIRAGRAAKIPVLYQELGTPHFLPELAVHYERFAEVIPLCSEVAALSPRLAQEWAMKFSSPHPISVVPLIFEGSASAQASRAASGPRRIVDGPTFGFAARLEHGKGLLVLIDAFARVRAQQGRGRLRISGVGPQEQAAKARATALGVQGACDFVGYTEPNAKSAFLQTLDLFVLPTLAEGTPNSLVEAMAHGLPVIASDVGGIPDMLSMESGILVPPGDREALADAMTRLTVDPDLRTRMGRASRGRYEALFTPTAVLPMLVDTYERIVARDSAARPRQQPTVSSAHPWLTLRRASPLEVR
jgi:glycosyltransferase involved in cell wall biosynthesis